jgi:hypothetical protein
MSEDVRIKMIMHGDDDCGVVCWHGTDETMTMHACDDDA